MVRNLYFSQVFLPALFVLQKIEDAEKKLPKLQEAALHWITVWATRLARQYSMNHVILLQI